MMKMKNCPSCGRIFVPMTATQRLCADCMEKERKKEHEVVEYVRDHPDVHIPQIIDATGATEKMIRRLIKEGRFIQVGVKLTYPCEKCGAPITQGKLCAKCAAELQKSLASAAEQIKKDRAAGTAGRGVTGLSQRGPRPDDNHPSAFRSERDSQRTHTHAATGKDSNRYRGFRER